MKKYMCLLFLISYNSLFCHKEWVHEYILKESYKLIFNEYGNIPKLAKACGFDDYENKHLPNIPSEKEAIENGVSLNGMQIKLLEKVEELTLYLILLNKQNKLLQERITSLEGRK